MPRWCVAFAVGKVDPAASPISELASATWLRFLIAEHRGCARKSRNLACGAVARVAGSALDVRSRGVTVPVLGYHVRGRLGCRRGQYRVRDGASMPFGFLIGTLIAAGVTSLALWPVSDAKVRVQCLRSWSSRMRIDFPFLIVYALAASTLLAVIEHDIPSPVGWIGPGVALLTTGGVAIVVRRALEARLRTHRRVDEWPSSRAAASAPTPRSSCRHRPPAFQTAKRERHT